MNTLFMFGLYNNWFWNSFRDWGFFSFAFGLTAYILLSIGLYRLAKNQNIANAWLSWIPIAQLYIIGKLVGSVDIGSHKITRLDIIMPVSPFVVAVFHNVRYFGSILGGLSSIALFIFFLYVLYHLYKKYVPEQAVPYTLLSIAVAPLMIFLIRDKHQLVA